MRYDPNEIPYDYTLEVTTRLKGLDLVDTVPEELWTEISNMVHEVVIKTIPKKKKCKKEKRMSEEALQIAEKRREVKGKGEKERYAQLNAEFQRIARRDKKAFLSEQCKEVKENNRKGMTTDLFKKTGDIKGTLHAGWTSKDLTGAEEIRKRWQEYIEELYKKVLMTWINLMVWTLTYSQTSWTVKSSGPKMHCYKQS